MTLEEKVEHLEKELYDVKCTLYNTLDIIKYFAQISTGITNEDTDYIIDQIYNIIR